LIKYKVQILLFILTGLIIGLGYPWYQSRKKITFTISQSKTDYSPEIKSAIDKGKQVRFDLFSTIDQIENNIQLLEVTAAEYRHTSEEKFDNLSIKIEAFEDFNPNYIQKDEGDIKNSDSSFLLFYTTQPSSTAKLKIALKNNYRVLAKADEQIGMIELEIKKGLVKKHINQGVNSAKSSTQPHFAEVQNRLAEQKHQRSYTLFNIRLLQFSLTDPIYLYTRQKQIPWNIWNDLVRQKRADKNEDQIPEVQLIKKIKGIEKIIEQIEKEKNKLKMMNYLVLNEVNLDRTVFNWPSVIALADANRPPPQPSIISRKILLISLIISLFLGVFSVYSRMFLRNMRKNEDFEKTKHELKEAVRFWKL